jgi:hypothetical protein
MKLFFVSLVKLVNAAGDVSESKGLLFKTNFAVIYETRIFIHQIARNMRVMSVIKSPVQFSNSLIEILAASENFNIQQLKFYTWKFSK